MATTLKSHAVSNVIIAAIAVLFTACKSLGANSTAGTSKTEPFDNRATQISVSISSTITSTITKDKTRIPASSPPTAKATQKNNNATPDYRYATDTYNPPTFIAVLPEISPSECLLTSKRDSKQLLGLWFRWRDLGSENEYEKLYFRDNHRVSIWLGGYVIGIGNIEPLILNGTVTHVNIKHISLNVSDWAYASLDYNVCGDLLAVYDSANAGNGVYSYIRIAEWCWDISDAYPDICYPQN
jgi:hypothetical protein